MRGLLLKDLLNLKQQGKLYLFVLIFLLCFVFVGNAGFFFSGIICFLAASIPVTLLAYDERAHWDLYALTMPVSKADMVISKYLFMLCTCTVSFFISFLLNVIISKQVFQSFMSALVISSFSIITISLALPFLFHFGAEKGRILLVALFFVIALLLGIIIPSTSSSSIGIIGSHFFIPLLLICMLCIIFLFCTVSAYISVRIYEKKEW